MDQQYVNDQVADSALPHSQSPQSVTPPKIKPKKAYRRTDFYRQSRALHAWLSAFAFLVLMFFALTGLLLNHPEWFAAKNDPQDMSFQLSSLQLAELVALENPTDSLLQTVRAKTDLTGRLKSSEVLADEVMIRLASPTGTTDISLFLDSGEVLISQEKASTVSMLNDLHRGKDVGVLWRWLIDISAVIILLLSLAGYVLFFSLKTRKATSLWLTAGSLLLIVLLGWLSV